jgi:hypothetical protein
MREKNEFAKPGFTDWEMKDSKFSLFFMKHIGRVSKQSPFLGLIHYRIVTET